MSAGTHQILSEQSEGISKDGIFWTYSYSSLAMERRLDPKAITNKPDTSEFRKRQVWVVFGRTEWVNAGLVPNVTPCATGYVPLQQLPLQCQVTGLNSHPTTAATDRWIVSCVARVCLAFPILLSYNDWRSSRWLNIEIKIQFLLRYYIEGLFKCFPLFYFQMEIKFTSKFEMNLWQQFLNSKFAINLSSRKIMLHYSIIFKYWKVKKNCSAL